MARWHSAGLPKNLSICPEPLANLCAYLCQILLLLFIRGQKGACPEKLTSFQVYQTVPSKKDP